MITRRRFEQVEAGVGLSNKRRASRLRRDLADAFFPDPAGDAAVVPDDLAEELAEEFIASATTGQEQAEEGHDQFVTEEIGGPFVITVRARRRPDGMPSTTAMFQKNRKSAPRA